MAKAKKDTPIITEPKKPEPVTKFIQVFHYRCLGCGDLIRLDDGIQPEKCRNRACSSNVPKPLDPVNLAELVRQQVAAREKGRLAREARERAAAEKNK